MLRNNQGRARMARLVFLLLALVSGALVLLSAAALDQPDWEIATTEVSSSFTSGLYYLYSLLSLVYVLLLVGSYIVLIMWMRRAYYNLHQRPDIHPDYSDSWAVWAWFVPFLNFARPFTIMREVWCDTQRAAWGRIIEPSTLVGWWWAAFVLKMIIGRITAKMGNNNTAGFTHDDLLATLIDACSQILAAGLTWYLIGRTTKFEDELAMRQEVEQLGQPTPTTQFINPDQSDYALEEGY